MHVFYWAGHPWKFSPNTISLCNFCGCFQQNPISSLCVLLVPYYSIITISHNNSASVQFFIHNSTYQGSHHISMTKKLFKYWLLSGMMTQEELNCVLRWTDSLQFLHVGRLSESGKEQETILHDDDKTDHPIHSLFSSLPICDLTLPEEIVDICKWRTQQLWIS